MSVFSADQLCVAVQDVLKEDLPAVIAHPQAAEFLEDGEYGPIAEWQQLPTVDALSTARFPAVAITSAGLVNTPSYRAASDSRMVTWRVVVGIYDRGRDHGDTQARIRNWCALIRTCLLRNPSLDGVADSLTWVGEEFALLPNRNQARTIAAGAVAFDVTAEVPALSSTDPDGPVVKELVLDRVQNYRHSVRNVSFQ